MSEFKSLSGKILVSQPKADLDPYFSKSVILVGTHNVRGSWGVMVNKTTPNLTLGTIMQSVGIDSQKTDRIFIGGPVDTHRVCIVHSLDWQSSNTIQITPEIGITNELQILAAISQNEGPALYRTCVGSCGWGAGQLDKEYNGEASWKPQNRWLVAPATIESIFNLSEEDQWQKSIEHVAQHAVSNWF
jgi:putative transcriptional regulator